MRFVIMPVSLLVSQKPICYTEEGVKERIIHIQPPQVKHRLLKIQQLVKFYFQAYANYSTNSNWGMQVALAILVETHRRRV